jgi:hypothetical protein
LISNLFPLCSNFYYLKSLFFPFSLFSLYISLTNQKSTTPSSYRSSAVSPPSSVAAQALTISSQPSISAPLLLFLIPTKHFLLAQIRIADLHSLFSSSKGLPILGFHFSAEIIFNSNKLIIQIRSQIVSEKKREYACKRNRISDEWLSYNHVFQVSNCKQLISCSRFQLLHSILTPPLYENRFTVVVVSFVKRYSFR